MKFSKLACAIAIAVSFSATAEPLDLSGQGYFTYGNTNTYSLPLSALQYDFFNGGGAGPGNPYYINSTPGAIKDTVVIYTGSGGQGVTTNVTGFEDAYGVPNGKTQPYAFMGTADGGVNVVAPTVTADKTASIADLNARSWDASLLAMKDFLNGGTPIFLFNNNDTNEDQTLSLWARLWITDDTGTEAANTRSLYLTNQHALSPSNGFCDDYTPCPYNANLVGGSLGGIPDGDATLFVGSGTDPITGTKAGTDFVRSGGAVDNPFGSGTVNHNLGANQVAYAGVLPLLDTWLLDMFGTKTDDQLAALTMHIDLRLGCRADNWGTYNGPANQDPRCEDIAIDNGFEQLFMISSETDNTNVPEPGSLALLGVALAGLAVVRQRQKANDRT